jgi:hypothetical protein
MEAGAELYELDADGNKVSNVAPQNQQQGKRLRAAVTEDAPSSQQAPDPLEPVAQTQSAPLTGGVVEHLDATRIHDTLPPGPPPKTAWQRTQNSA